VKRLVVLTICLLLVALLVGCGLAKRDFVGPDPSTASLTVTAGADPASGIAGEWTQVVGDSETVVTFGADAQGSAWSHTTIASASGLSAQSPFKYSGDATVTLVFDDGSQDVFVIDRMSAGAMEVRATGDPTWMKSGLWLRAK